MAISRREILKLGVSYGTGSINFGNDSVVYDRELRKFPQSTTLQEFLDALAEAEDRLAAEAEQAANEEPGSENDGASAETASDNSLDTEEEQQGDNSDAPESGESDAEETPGNEEADAQGADESSAADQEPEPEPTHENPLNEAIHKAGAFREECARLALSELYIATSAVISEMKQESLPAVEEIEEIKEKHAALVDYLLHH